MVFPLVRLVRHAARALGRIRKKLAKKKITAKEFVTNTTYQRYIVGLSEGKDFALNEKAILEDAKKDGFFGVLTNIKDMPAKDIVAHYKSLWIIEDAFGEIKGSLRARPIFHWSDRNIIGHLTMCFLAYLCEALMTKALRAKNLTLESRAIQEEIIEPRPLTVLEAMRELQEVRAIPVQIKSTTMWVRTDIAGNAQKLGGLPGTRGRADDRPGERPAVAAEARCGGVREGPCAGDAVDRGGEGRGSEWPGRRLW